MKNILTSEEIQNAQRADHEAASVLFTVANTNPALLAIVQDTLVRTAPHMMHSMANAVAPVSVELANHLRICATRIETIIKVSDTKYEEDEQLCLFP